MSGFYVLRALQSTDIFAREDQFGGQFLPAILGILLQEERHGRPILPRKPTF